jgi:TonB-dependent starch-binding outer membrane protein SusC
LILAAPTLYTVGVPGSSISTNIGGMNNKGFEITLESTPVQTRDFSWSTSINYTNIKNKVTGLVPSNNNADITSGFQVASVGRPIGTYKMPVWAGVDAATGNPMWNSGTGAIKMWDFASQSWKDDKGVATTALSSTTDYVYLDGKSGLPTWYGGWDNTVTFRNFDLNVSIVYQGGNYILNSTKANMLSNFFTNNFDVIKGRWTTPGQQTDIPKLWASDNTANQTSTRFLEKGDFARVRTITLGYNLSRKLLDRLGITNVRVYAQAFNPFLLTKYSGLDPDVNYNSFSNIAVGTDNRATPQMKVNTIGVNVTF